MVECSHCGREFHSKGIKSHVWRVHGAGKDFKPTPAGSKTIWNKGKTKDSDSRIAKYAQTLGGKFSSGVLAPGGCFSPSYHGSEKFIESSRKGGGYRERAGRSKKFRVVDSFGVSCVLQSSYELRLSQIFDSIGVKWSKPKRMFPYLLGEKSRKYYPDFQVGDRYLDTKNDYLFKVDSPKIKAVIEQNDIDLVILREHQINEEFVRALIAQW